MIKERIDYADPNHPCLGEGCKCHQLRKGITTRKDIKHNKARSVTMENAVAEGYRNNGFPKARRVPLSGALGILPGDIDPSELLLVEGKMTRKGNLTIDPKWIRQVTRQANDLGRRGFAALHAWVLNEEEGETQYSKVVIVTEPLWFEILREYKRTHDK